MTGNRAGKKRKVEALAQNEGDVNVNNIKAVQESINTGHMFGIKIWKPALYAKHRSIDAHSYQDLHQQPATMPSSLHLSNFIYVLLIGWWLSLVYLCFALILLPFWCLGNLLLVLGTARYRDSFHQREGIVLQTLRDVSNLDDYLKVCTILKSYWSI